MNKFIIPQFIDVEDRIFGPITVRQFAICTIGGLLIFAAYKLSDFYLFLIEAVFIGGLSGLFAFGKINGKKFHIFLLDLIEFILKVPKFAIWQRSEDIPIIKKIEEKKDDFVFEPKKFSSKKLSEISLIVDTGGIYGGESNEEEQLNNKEIKDNNINLK